MKEKTEKEKTAILTSQVNKISDMIDDDTELFKPLEETKEDGEDILDELTIAKVKLNPLHLACLDDELRPNARLIEIKNNIASATNDLILVKIDLSLTTSLTKQMLCVLDGKFIHMSVWAEICNCDVLTLSEDLITCNKSGINKMFEYSNPQGSMFAMNDIVTEINLAGEEKKRIIAYNTKLIATLSKIFNCEILNFSFSNGNKGTFVYPHYDCGMFAVLMPVEDTAENRYFFI